MKLLAKIPKDAEAVIVLVGKLLETVLIVCRSFFFFSFCSSLVLKYQSATDPLASTVKIFVKAPPFFFATENVVLC